MDLVRIARVGGIALGCVCALGITTGRCGAEPLAVGAPPAKPAIDMAARFDAAFRSPDRPSAFALDGWALSAPSGAIVHGLPVGGAPAFTPLIPTTARGPSPWADHVAEAAARFDVPPEWIHAVMQAESGGRTTLNGRPITSSAGAMGLMQVMPATFAELARRHGLGGDPHEPRANILAGAAYMREMIDRYGAPAFLAAYNAGPGRLDDHILRGRPLPEETRRYLAALAPKLAPGAAVALASADLETANPPVAGLADAAVNARTPAAPPGSARPPAPSLFVSSGTAPRLPAYRAAARPADALFVPPRRLDRRRVDTPADAPRD